MQKNRLGRSELHVSPYCLGTMTWGAQTGTRRAHAQIDTALDHGINFIDTAEIYPMDPVRSETLGRTERILGLWLDNYPGRRADLVIATKIAGPGMRKMRGGAPITPDTIREGVEGSLRRMKTDYIDLYQFHWPNRGSPQFRRDWDQQIKAHDRQAVTDNMAACLEALAAERKRGTIRAFGLSNETAWGMSNWLQLSATHNGPRPISIQNEYNLLHRQFDTDLAELCLYDDVGLLASAPLAAGLLTGKYQGGAVPKGSRMERQGTLNNRATPNSFAAVESYLDIAFKHDLDPVQMAMTWAATRPFVASVVFGVRTAEQMTRILEGAALSLSDDVLTDIAKAHKDHPLAY